MISVIVGLRCPMIRNLMIFLFWLPLSLRDIVGTLLFLAVPFFSLFANE